ncbi:MAG: ParB/RepB/Spo0J family partition protein [Rickettsiaceae bacterium]|nr:ParB/RepB/Spo0J family partition protein [Rickettsiaceae bacterium]
MSNLKGLKNLSRTNADITEQYNKNSIIVPIEYLVSSNLQPRNIFDQKDIGELANSISQNGILQPIITRKIDDKYEIIAGERRWRAAKIAGLVNVPIIVKNFDDQKALLVALTENLQRADLGALEEAKAYDFLAKTYSFTHEKIAELLSKPRVTVTNTMRLLSLGDLAKSYLVEGIINAGQGRALLSLANSDQDKAVQFIVDKRLNVRQTEQYVKSFNNNKNHSSKLFYNQDQIVNLQKSLNYKINKIVDIRQNSKNEKIKVTIEFDNLDEVESFFKD